MVAPDRVQSLIQTEQNVYKQMTDVELSLLYCNTWNSFKNVIYKMFLQIIYIYT